MKILQNRTFRVIIELGICILIPLSLTIFLGNELYPHTLSEKIFLSMGTTITLISSLILMWETLSYSKELHTDIKNLVQYSKEVNIKLRR